MPGPQSPYPHPGPSSYYPPPPNMPHYSYTNIPAPYPYQYPPPPMNGHSPAPPSPRVSGRAGYHSAPRGGPGPNFAQNYLHQPHPHPHHPPPSHASYIPHVPMHSPQPSPTNAYQHHQKYPPNAQQAPYTSPYPPPAHQQSWTFQQPISPLPKQLSMPPPPALSPIASSPKAPMILDGPLDPEPTDESAGSSNSPRGPSPEPAAEESTPASSSSPPVCPPPCSPSCSSQASQSLPSTPQVSIHPEPVPTKSQAPSHPKPQLGGWAIWSRRPTDPSLAPGIIISPHSRPPPDVIEKALRLPTPPESPKPVAVSLVTPSNVAIVSGPSSTQAPPEEPPKLTLDSAEFPPNDLPEPETVSSSGTDNSTVSDTPPVPVSPLSSSTSVSAAGTAHSQTKLGPEASEATTSVAALASSDETPSVEVPDSAAVAPSPPADTSTPTPPPASSTSTAPAPASAPPVLKKSWASLLRPASGDTSTSKSSLPTSSVVGFSIPASPPPARVPPVRRPELLALLNGTAPSRSALPRLRARGIVNSGNMCFANAVLQLLVYSPPFWRLFKELGRLLGQREREGQESGDGATPLVDATVKLLEEFVYEEKKVLPTQQQQGSRSKAKEEEKKEEEGVDSFMPTYVYDAMKEKKRFDNMRGGHQEDAEEFLGFYLDTLEEELLGLLSSISPPKPASAVSDKVEEREEGLQSGAGWTEVGKRNKMVLTRAVKSVESPITRIFGGKFRSTLRAPHQRDSVVVEDWRSLQLDIQRDSVHTIQDALSYISHPQPVQVGPSGSSEASQQVHIEALPPVLVLHLKRFLYDTAARGVVKIGKPVQFSPELEIPFDIMAPACKRPARYTLYGVLYHHGVSAGGGHYTLDVLHPNPRGGTSSSGRAANGEAWLHIDDETVSAVQHEDIFGRGDGKERSDDRCAYLLFYRRTALART
ncbi:cysteine proteinase [Lactarius akahatsu]|uniref:Ubiquitin carboxyl-terminal hydrolase n=1 Tax=Lactarius akahatsu TaxID=416441 RepID=A0AAD4LU41_9AGAM|nr:cysteine proteinase [Lactarius akahatsu]